MLGRSLWIACALLVASLMLIGPAFGQGTRPADGAATAPALRGERLPIEITGVEGFVQVQADDDAPWERAEVGMVLDEGATFRTGPKSAVRFAMPPGQVVTLDRLGKVKVVDAIRDENRVVTNLGMEYGRTRYDVEAAGLEHTGTIRSPSATLAIRGTQTNLTDTAPFPVVAYSLTGRVEFTPKGKKGTTFGGNKKAKVTEDELNPAEVAKDESVADPGSTFGRTDIEFELIGDLPSIGFFEASELGGVDDFRDLVTSSDSGSESPGGGGEPPPLPLQGRLNFFVSWNGPADLDMYVITPLNEGLAAHPPGGIPGFGGVPARTVASGGEILVDDTSGDGIEQARWENGYPGGTYTVGTRVFSDRGGVTNFFIDAFREGNRVGSRFSGSLDQTGEFAQTTFNIVGSGDGEGGGTETGGESLVMSFGGRRSLIQGEFNSRAAKHRGRSRRR